MEILSDTVFRGANVTLSGGTLTINDGTSTNKLVLNGGLSGSNFTDFLHISKNDSCIFSITPYGGITTNGGVNIHGSSLYLTRMLSDGGCGGCAVILQSGCSPSIFTNGLALENGNGGGCLKIGSIEILKGANTDSLEFLNHDNPVSRAYLDLQNADGGIILTSTNYSNYIQKPQESLKHESIYINFDVPADCTIFSLTTGGKFYHSDLFSATMMKYDSDLKFGNETIMAWKPVDVDVLVACQVVGTILVRKSSSFAMNRSDGYTLNLVYTSDQDVCGVVCAASPT